MTDEQRVEALADHLHTAEMAWRGDVPIRQTGLHIALAAAALEWCEANPPLGPAPEHVCAACGIEIVWQEADQVEDSYWEGQVEWPTPCDVCEGTTDLHHP